MLLFKVCMSVVIDLTTFSNQHIPKHVYHYISLYFIQQVHLFPKNSPHTQLNRLNIVFKDFSNIVSSHSTKTSYMNALRTINLPSMYIFAYKGSYAQNQIGLVPVVMYRLEERRIHSDIISDYPP